MASLVVLCVVLVANVVGWWLMIRRLAETTHKADEAAAKTHEALCSMRSLDANHKAHVGALWGEINELLRDKHPHPHLQKAARANEEKG